jgi:hypothetical protein
MNRVHTRLLGITLFLTLAPTVPATTWYVNGTSGNNANDCKSPTTACKTIGDAISRAASGDSVMVSAATYTEALTISLNLNVIGASASTTIIDGWASGTVVTISNTTARVTLSNLTIRNGKASVGAGIRNAGTLTLSKSTVTGNSAPIPCHRLLMVCSSYGAALGGGIYNSGVLTISNSTISANHAGSFCNATPCSAVGGGIYNYGTQMVIENSTLTGNSASTACSTGGHCAVGVGGAFYTLGGTVTLNNSTITGSSAYRCSGTCGGTGGAIVNGSGTFAMDNSTVSGNPAGGIVNGGTATLQNSIVDNNAGINCGGTITITSHGYNLSSDDTCKLNGPGDLNNHDPLLGPLQNNGGATQTMALLPGSPAIDGGNPSGCTDNQGHLLKTDQRGMPRPDPEDRGGCDVGAYERQSD